MPEIEDKNAIINDSDSLSNKTKGIPAPEVRKDIDTEGKFISEVTSAINNNDLDTSTINSFSQASQSREEIYNLIDDCDSVIGNKESSIVSKNKLMLMQKEKIIKILDLLKEIKWKI